MRSIRIPGLILALVVLTMYTLPGGLLPSGAQPPKKEQSLPAPLPVEKGMHEFMEYLMEPSYLRLKEVMAVKDKDKKHWKTIKADGLVLAEGSNLLLERLPDKDKLAWANHAFATREAGSQLYQAARKKDEAVAVSAYKTMINNCNACHKQFADGMHQLEP